MLNSDAKAFTLTEGGRAHKSLFVPYLLAFLILSSNPVWFTWNWRFYIVTFFVLLLFLSVLRRLKRQQIKLFIKMPIIILLLVGVGVFSFIGGFQTYTVFFIITYISCLLISDNEKVKAVEILTRSLASIILISFIPWFINTYIYSLPYYNIISYYESKGMDVVIENYLLFIQVQHVFLQRFYSIFDEPGTLGTLSAFILFANNFNTKSKANWIILVGNLFTFSLAFYVLTLSGFVFRNISNFKRLIILFAILFTLAISSILLFGSNETFNATIMGRFTDFDSALEGRTSSALQAFYNNYITSTEAIFGKGRGFLLANPEIFRGQGYQFFIIEFGLFGFAVIFLTYFSLISPLRVTQVLLLILFLLSFYQRPFLFTPWQMALFSAMLGCIRLGRPILKN